jgi:Raf kinase inhibitor-like YbhB/YbcL family protein
MRPAVPLLASLLVACGGGAAEPTPTPPSSPLPSVTRIVLESPAFEEGTPIPAAFTCDGEDVSPPLRWSGVPEEAASLTLTLYDPEAPGGGFLHWHVTGIDPVTRAVARGEAPPGEEQTNGFGETGYGGPCPPEGDPPHNYRFILEALGPDGTVIGAGTLTGRYGR